MRENPVRTSHSARRKPPVMEIFWGIVILVAIAFFVPRAIDQTSRSQREESLRRPLEWGDLPALRAQMLSDASREEYDSFAQSAIDVVYAQTVQTPVCVILEDRTEKGESPAGAETGEESRFFILSPEKDGFTDNPAQAKTHLFARMEKDDPVTSYQLFSLSAGTGSVFPIVDEEGKTLNTSILEADKKKTQREKDQIFCEWLLETLPPSDATADSVARRHAELDSPVLSAENVSALTEQAWNTLSVWAFSSALKQTETDFSGKLRLPEEIETVSPTLIIERYGAPDPSCADPDQHRTPDYAEWIRDAEIRYCVSPCADLLRVQVTEPRYVMVCENLGYCAMGEFEKIGKLYSYYTRNTLIDLKTREIIGWNLSYLTKGLEKTYSVGIQKFSTGSYYVPDRDYQTDRNGRRMFQSPHSGSGWETLLGIDDNYQWGGTAVIRSVKAIAPDL